MTRENKLKTPRRFILQAFLALPALSLFRTVAQPSVSEEIVEVDGWILKRSEVA